MSPGVGIQVDMNDVPDRIRDKAEKLEDPESVLEDFGSRLVREWTNSFAQTPTGESSDPGNPPAINTGELKNSLTWETRDNELEAGTPVVYGRIQHFGGTIEPVDAQALTIPLTRDAKKTNKRAGDYSGLYFRPSGGGSEDNVIGVLGKDKAGGFQPIFALATEVTLPERPWLLIRNDDWEYLEAQMIKELEDR